MNHDQHRRDADALKQAELIRAAKQHRRNAAEWTRRATRALFEGNTELATNQFNQAVYEVGMAR